MHEEKADMVARYLVAADLADDPEQGYAYAQAAKRLAARVGVVREAGGIAAYRTGRWAEALAELRAARRLTGRDDYLPIMADCERALGRLDRALALVREASTADLDRATRIRAVIAEEHEALLRSVAVLIAKTEPRLCWPEVMDKASEILHEAVHEALRDAPSFDPTRSATAWVRGIAAKRLLTRRRQQARAG